MVKKLWYGGLTNANNVNFLALESTTRSGSGSDAPASGFVTCITVVIPKGILVSCYVGVLVLIPHLDTHENLSPCLRYISSSREDDDRRKSNLGETR
jgi:hypothetical protein